MPILEHLFLKGEFAERKRLLSGLTFEQVSVRFNSAPHSIYEELWHATAYQRASSIHNAYHLGKIMALRQQMGAWPPENEKSPLTS